MNTNDLAAGWLRIQNGQSNPVDLIFEPWGIGPRVPLPPGEAFDIYVTPLSGQDGEQEVPHIEFSEDMIVLYADLERSVVYYKGKPLENILSQLEAIPVPPFGSWQNEAQP